MRSVHISTTRATREDANPSGISDETVEVNTGQTLKLRRQHGYFLNEGESAGSLNIASDETPIGSTLSGGAH